MKKIKDPALFEKIRQFLTEYMPIIKRESANTVIAYRYTLNLYLTFLQRLLSKGLNSITSADFNQKNILAFMDWLRSYRRNKISTVNLRLVHLRRFCRFLMEENILLLSELSAIQKIEEFPKEYADGIKYLTIQEMKLVLAQPDPYKEIGFRDRFFMHLLYDSGCRIQEILDLTIRDFSVNSSGARLCIIGKGNKFRATPISEELIPMYKEYCVHFHKNGNLDDYLFYTKRNGTTTKMSCDNAQRFISKYGTKARNLIPAIPHLHPHIFRHTRAMHLYMAGMPLEMVAQWLGHSLAKVAMDIWAKHTRPDKNGVRIAEMDEMSYRKLLWEHRPLTDFWRVGRGYAKKLEAQGLFTMGDIARCSIGKPTDYYNEDLLYKMFGVNAELLVDHSWGWEPVTMADIKAYKPEAKSVGSGQVLSCPYEFDKARMVAWEMADQLALDLVNQRLVTDQLTLTVGYDIENLRDAERRKQYKGAVTTDRYGRQIPKHAHGTANLDEHTASSKRITGAILKLFDRIVDRNLLIRRMNLTANRVTEEGAVPLESVMEQLDLFTDSETAQKEREMEAAELAREKKIQKAMLGIKSKYGKNAILKGTNLVEGATAAERNGKIGGHRA